MMLAIRTLRGMGRFANNLPEGGLALGNGVAFGARAGGSHGGRAGELARGTLNRLADLRLLGRDANSAGSRSVLHVLLTLECGSKAHSRLFEMWGMERRRQFLVVRDGKDARKVNDGRMMYLSRSDVSWNDRASSGKRWCGLGKRKNGSTVDERGVKCAERVAKGDG